MPANSGTPRRIVKDGAMTGTGTLTGYIDCKGASLMGLHAIWTGTPNGSFAFYGSNNWSETQQSGDWVALTLASSPPSPAGSASSWLLDFVDYAYGWIKVVYTNSSSTGTLNLWATGKK